MAKRPEIANEDEYNGWKVILSLLEFEITKNEIALDNGHYPAKAIKGKIAAATKARDALLGPIRKYQESREVIDNPQ